jgi:hypothetical protein
VLFLVPHSTFQRDSGVYASFFVQPFCLIVYLNAATFLVRLIIRIKKVSDKCVR